MQSKQELKLLRTSMLLAYRDSKCRNLSVYCPYQEIVCFVLNRLALNSVVLGQPLASQLGRSRSGVTTSCYNSVYGVPSGD